MASAYTPEELARAVLSVFKHFNARPGHVVMSQNLVGLLMPKYTADEIGDGVQHGVGLGWFKHGSSDTLVLTQSGYDEV